jgi:hypothetical protein
MCGLSIRWSLFLPCIYRDFRRRVACVLRLDPPVELLGIAVIATAHVGSVVCNGKARCEIYDVNVCSPRWPGETGHPPHRVGEFDVYYPLGVRPDPIVSQLGNTGARIDVRF